MALGTYCRVLWGGHFLLARYPVPEEVIEGGQDGDVRVEKDHAFVLREVPRQYLGG